MALLLLGTLGLVGFAALSWVILLSGVASLHSLYAEVDDAYEANGLSLTNESWISDALGLAWWMVWYQFLLLIAVTVSASMGLLKQHAQVLGNFLSALFALQMHISHEATVLNRSTKDTFTRYHSRAGAFLAGAIMCALSTVLLIIWLGNLPGNSSNTTATTSQKHQGFPPPHGAPIQSVPSGVPQYMATATGSSQGGPPMMPPPLPGMPPAHQGYQHAGQPGYVDQGYGQNAPPAPHEALPAPVGGDQYPDQHYQNQPSY